MSELHAMMARHAQPGRVEWIGVRSQRRADLVPLETAQVTVSGLEGDHGRAGKRAVTLVQAEHLAAIGAYLGRSPVWPGQLRRNIVVAGLNLAALKDRRIAVGGAVLHLSTICAPCSRMEEEFGHGGYAAVRGHGGWCASVVEPGLVRVGDAVRPLD